MYKRQLQRASHNYRVAGKLKTDLLYIKARETNIDLTGLSHYFDNEVIITTVEGDHFSILKLPSVNFIANEVLNYFKNTSIPII